MKIAIRLLSFLSLPATLSPVCAQKSVDNVILILADDLGCYLSALGTPGLSTPAIDRLIGEGTFYAQALSSCSSSAPSRSSILTGMYPHSNGHWRNTHSLSMSSPEEDFRPDTPMKDVVGVHEWVQTLPEILSAEGWYTAITHKYHLSYPWKFRFDSRLDPPSQTRQAYYSQILNTIRAIGSRSFFIMANLQFPHRPCIIPSHYAGEKASATEIAIPAYLPDTEEVRKDLANYYTCIMQVDRMVDGILAALKESGHGENTLVIFTSDQGIPMHRAKATAYYEGVHVPLVFWGTGVPEGIRHDTPVSLVDLMPTLLDAAGIAAPRDQFQGISLWPSLQSGREPEKRYIFVEHNAHGPSPKEFYPSRAVFDGRYYLIKNLMPERTYTLPADLATGGNPWFNYSYQSILDRRQDIPYYYNLLEILERGRPPMELYDIQADPFQLTNLSNDSKHIQTLKRLSSALQQWQGQTGDTPELLEEMLISFSKPIPFAQETARRKKLQQP